MFSRISGITSLVAWRHWRTTLWVTAGGVGFGFLIALGIAARRYGQPGPISNQVKALIFAPKPGPLYGGMALMM
ncbi:DUF5933 domain-containing protein, partial [Streptomyces regalis]|uniref:DUF5933 domain-containing protein n=1 Tax=Streptomyces regalis TaxID=68262 RepID=UPI000AA94BCD